MFESTGAVFEPTGAVFELTGAVFESTARNPAEAKQTRKEMSRKTV